MTAWLGFDFYKLAKKDFDYWANWNAQNLSQGIIVHIAIYELCVFGLFSILIHFKKN